MNIYSISLRLLLSKKQFSYTNISIFLSSFSFMLAISISLLVIGVTRGYKKNIELEISKIEPDLLVTHYQENFMSSDLINSFIQKNISFSLDTLVYAKYIESYAMIKKKGDSKGIIIYALEKEKITQIFDFKYLKEYNNDENFLFVSKYLYDEMNLSQNEEIYIFNIEKMIQDESIKGIKNKITGIYETNIKTFDKNIVFISFNKAKSLLELDNNMYSGLMIESINNDYLNHIEYESELLYQTWKEKHANLLSWLMIFSNPIKLILIFVLSLSIIYKVFTFWLILYDKTSSLNHLKVLGATDKVINKISYNIIILLSLFSIIFGCVIAIFLSNIQNKYQIITVNPTIYILSDINSIITPFDIFYLSILSLFILILLTRIITYFKFKEVIVNKL